MIAPPSGSIGLRRPDYGIADLRGDLLGGITAGVVSLPIAMGYGILSGLGPAAGLYGALATALISAIVGGARGVIAGPNVIVAMIVAVVVTDYASSLAEAATIGIMAGAIQLVFALLRLGRYVTYVPQSLVSGFFTAFGILVIASQVFPALGVATGGVGLIDNLTALPDAVRDLNAEALSLALLCLVLGAFWRGRAATLLPGSFVVLLVGTAVGALWLDSAPVVSDIPLGLPGVGLSALSADFVVRAIEPAFMLALLSSISILVVSLNMDVITGTQHQSNRTLFGLGLGNIIAATFGGLSGAASSATFVNIFSGGRTVVAGLTVAGFLLAVIIFMGPLVERIPLAVLAAILITAGWSLIDWRFVLRLHRIPASFAIVMVVTVILSLLTTLAAALVIGLVVAWLLNARRLEELEMRSLASVPLLDATVLGRDELGDADRFRARSGLVVLPDRVTMASARQIGRVLRVDLSQHRAIIFEMSRVQFMDDSAAVTISDLIHVARSRGARRVVISGLPEDVGSRFHSMALFDDVPEEDFAADLDEAKQKLRQTLLSLT
ncbi:MAG: SulP family inorganic anion transporter [Chloroflexota bacterium]|nr:SulP family inorganic anion transporter [Chloroflexota bacterium]